MGGECAVVVVMVLAVPHKPNIKQQQQRQKRNLLYKIRLMYTLFSNNKGKRKN